MENDTVRTALALAVQADLGRPAVGSARHRQDVRRRRARAAARAAGGGGRRLGPRTERLRRAARRPRPGHLVRAAALGGTAGLRRIGAAVPGRADDRTPGLVPPTAAPPSLPHHARRRRRPSPRPRRQPATRPEPSPRPPRHRPGPPLRRTHAMTASTRSAVPCSPMYGTAAEARAERLP